MTSALVSVSWMLAVDLSATVESRLGHISVAGVFRTKLQDAICCLVCFAREYSAFLMWLLGSCLVLGTSIGNWY